MLPTRHLGAGFRHCALIAPKRWLIGDPAMLSLTAERRIDRKTPGHKAKKPQGFHLRASWRIRLGTAPPPGINLPVFLNSVKRFHNNPSVCISFVICWRAWWMILDRSTGSNGRRGDDQTEIPVDRFRALMEMALRYGSTIFCTRQSTAPASDASASESIAPFSLSY